MNTYLAPTSADGEQPDFSSNSVLDGRKLPVRRRQSFLLQVFGLVLAMGLSAASFAFDLQGHRGARGLAPENTLTAFALALKTGVSTLELDIGLTADGVVVIAHDPYLNPAITRDASGQWLTASKGPLINTLTLAQLQAFDVGRINPASTYFNQFSSQQARDGEHIPTLAALFDLVKTLGANKVRFNIETKLNPLQAGDTASPEVMTAALLKVVRDAGLSKRVTVQSFDWRSLKLVQQLEPGLPTACLTVQSSSSNTAKDPRWMAGLKLDDYPSLPDMVKAANCSSWSPNSGALTQDQVKQAQALGLKVLPWTVNSAADMQKLLDWKVDGIITDYPDRLREVMDKRGLTLPPGHP
ncbi:MAG: glycerophosphodiester phosphodiesterase [Pseudomonadota bacterium]